MLCTRQVRAAFACLAIQSVAVAAAAVLGQEPLMMIPPAVMLATVWAVRRCTASMDGADTPATRIPGVIPGGILALLCQSQGEIGLPLAVILLAVVLAATRRHPVMQLMAVGAMMNGIALGGYVLGWDGLLPLACLVLPLPLAISLVVKPWRFVARAVRCTPRRAASWLGWISFAAFAAIFVATLTVPLRSLASVFAPLIAFDGLLRAWIERNRAAVPVARRAASLLKLGFILLAVCTSDPILAWLAVLCAAAVSLPPVAADNPERATLAWLAAGLALFGLLVLPVEPSPPAFLSLFGGYTILAAVVPDLAIPLLVLVLRFADEAVWPAAADALGTGLALIALLSCSVLLLRLGPNHRAVLLQLGQASIAALAIATSQAEGRFAAVVLLVLLLLTRTACRVAGGPAAVLARAGLAGLPPLGVFPGLMLVVLAFSSHAPWLLLPLGVAVIPILLAGLPARLPAVSLRTAMLSAGWLPLVLAALFGFFTPTELVLWLAALTAGPS
jgi:hypothetical protein